MRPLRDVLHALGGVNSADDSDANFTMKIQKAVALSSRKAAPSSDPELGAHYPALLPPVVMRSTMVLRGAVLGLVCASAAKTPSSEPTYSPTSTPVPSPEPTASYQPTSTSSPSMEPSPSPTYNSDVPTLTSAPSAAPSTYEPTSTPTAAPSPSP